MCVYVKFQKPLILLMMKGNENPEYIPTFLLMHKYPVAGKWKATSLNTVK